MSSFKDSEISQTLDVANAGARYDAAARKLVAQKSILAYILKSTMDEFADVPVERIAEELIEDFPSVSEMAVFQDTPDTGYARYFTSKEKEPEWQQQNS